MDNSYLYLVWGAGIVILPIIFVIFVSLAPQTIYFEYGECVPAPVHADLGTGLVFIAGVPVSIKDDWAQKALSGKDIKAWKMEDGLITEMDLRGTNSWAKPVKKSVGASGVIRSAVILRDCIARQEKREVTKSCLWVLVLLPYIVINLVTSIVWVIPRLVALM